MSGRCEQISGARECKHESVYGLFQLSVFTCRIVCMCKPKYRIQRNENVCFSVQVLKCIQPVRHEARLGQCVGLGIGDVVPTRPSLRVRMGSGETCLDSAWAEACWISST